MRPLYPAKWVEGITPFTLAVGARKIEIIDLFLEKGMMSLLFPTAQEKHAYTLLLKLAVWRFSIN
jgi:hypothetical protein